MMLTPGAGQCRVSKAAIERLPASGSGSSSLAHSMSVERRESTARLVGTADHVDEDVDPAELLQHRTGDRADTFASKDHRQ